MFNDNTIISIILQTISLFILLVVSNFFYKSNQMINIPRRKIIFCFTLGAFIFGLFCFNLTKILAFYLIIVTIALMFYQIKEVIVFYLVLVLLNLLFVNNYSVLIIYLLMFFLTYICGLVIKKSYYKLLTAFFLSLLFLNIELLMFNYSLSYVYLYNLSCFIVWLSIINIGNYLIERNMQIVAKNQMRFIDQKTAVKNYYCLLNDSYQLLKRRKKNIAVLLINIDRLVDINSLYGKQYGDDIIRIVAKKIKADKKDYGEIYRLDGNTFCVLALDELFETMKVISEKIKLDIEIKSPIIDNNKIKLTVSIGGYYGRIMSKNIDDYIEIAHGSMLKSKFNGRNRVILNYNMVKYHNVM